MPSSFFHPGASDHDSCEGEQFDIDMPPASVAEQIVQEVGEDEE